MPSRIIREGILTSERINSLSFPAEVFYRRLMSVVDDFGRFDARLSMLRASCYPLKVDVVREADISRWIAECEKAGVIALYAANRAGVSRWIAACEKAGAAVSGDEKPYLLLVDFRQQVRAKDSKFPHPPNPCEADAQHVHSKCEADAHVDGGGVVDEYVYQPPPARDDESGSFSMNLGWIPSSHFPSLSKQAGLPMPGSEQFESGLAEFKSYWLTQPNRTRTQHEWDHALVKSLKADQVRSKSNQPARASPTSRRQTISDDRKAASMILTGRKPENERPTANTERDITADCQRIA